MQQAFMQSETRSGSFTTSRLVVGASLCAATFIVGSGHSLSPDEGVVLASAWKMSSGDRPYSDYFELIAPGAGAFAALAMQLLGPYYWSAKVLAIMLVGLSALGVFDLAWRLGAKLEGAWAAGLLWVVMTGSQFLLINHNTWSSAFAVLGTALLARRVAARAGAAGYFVAGIALGLVPVFLQTKGLVLITSLTFLLLGLLRARICRGIDVAASLTGMAIPCLSLLFFWPAALLLDSLIIWPAVHYRDINEVSPIPLLIAAAIFTGLFAVAWRKSGRESRIMLSVLGTAQLALYVSVMTRPDMAHVLLASFSLPVILAMVLGKSEGHLIAFDVANRAFKFTLGTVLVLFLVLNALLTVDVQSRLTKIRTLVTGGGGALYAYPFLPNYYFELGVRDPYPHMFLFTNMHSAEQFERNLAVLKRERPGTILRSRFVGDKFGYDWGNPHDRWINVHYRPIETVGDVEVLRHKGL